MTEAYTQNFPKTGKCLQSAHRKQIHAGSGQPGPEMATMDSTQALSQATLGPSTCTLIWGKKVFCYLKFNT